MKRYSPNTFIPNVVQRSMVYCQNILPLAFDNSLSYYEFLCVMNAKVNEVIQALNNQNLSLIEFEKLVAQKEQSFEDYINSNFANLTETVNTFTAEITADWEEYKTEINTSWAAYRTAINNQLSEFSATLTDYASRISAAENTANAAAETAETAAAAVSAYDTRIENLETAVEELETDFVGKVSPEGETVTIDGIDYTYGAHAEYFNNYEGTDKNESVGANTSTFGVRNANTGNNGFVTGNDNVSHAVTGFTGGSTNTNAGQNAVVFGAGNNITNGGQFSFVTGRLNVANVANAVLHGIGHTTDSNATVVQMIIGQYSVTDGSKLFIVGGGSSTQDRKNAFAVDSNGYIFNPACNSGIRISDPMTQADYDLLPNPDSRTLYIII